MQRTSVSLLIACGALIVFGVYPPRPGRARETVARPAPRLDPPADAPPRPPLAPPGLTLFEGPPRPSVLMGAEFGPPPPGERLYLFALPFSSAGPARVRADLDDVTLYDVPQRPGPHRVEVHAYDRTLYGVLSARNQADALNKVHQRVSAAGATHPAALSDFPTVHAPDF